MNFKKTFVLISSMIVVTAVAFYLVYANFLSDTESMVVQEIKEIQVYDVVEVDEATIKKGQSNLDLVNAQANLQTAKEVNQAEIKEANTPEEKPEEKTIKKLQR